MKHNHENKFDQFGKSIKHINYSRIANGGNAAFVLKETACFHVL
jgi:hypothetical protein